MIVGRTPDFGIMALVMVILVAWPQWSGHAADKDGGFIAYPGVAASPGPVLFSHVVHGVKGAGYACNRCHENMAVALNVTMADIRQRRVCGACHDGKNKGPRSPMAAGSIDDCKSCHMPAADVVITMNRMDPVPFSHLRHLAVAPDKKSVRQTGLSCDDCHPVPFDRAEKSPVGMQVPHENGAGCARCHNGQKRKDGAPTAFSATSHCLSCHKSQILLKVDSKWGIASAAKRLCSS
jgi:c(7)-type cytochrome triheme protein